MPATNPNPAKYWSFRQHTVGMLGRRRDFGSRPMSLRNGRHDLQIADGDRVDVVASPAVREVRKGGTADGGLSLTFWLTNASSAR
jgi:hypothetical protein